MNTEPHNPWDLLRPNNVMPRSACTVVKHTKIYPSHPKIFLIKNPNTMPSNTSESPSLHAETVKTINNEVCTTAETTIPATILASKNEVAAGCAKLTHSASKISNHGITGTKASEYTTNTVPTSYVDTNHSTTAEKNRFHLRPSKNFYDSNAGTYIVGLYKTQKPNKNTGLPLNKIIGHKQKSTIWEAYRNSIHTQSNLRRPTCPSNRPYKTPALPPVHHTRQWESPIKGNQKSS